MFATYPQYKLPLQFPGHPSTTWTGVEFVLNQPFYLCSLDVEGSVQRFFLTQERDVVQMARNTTEDRLVAVDLFLPPEWADGASWQVLPVKRIMQRRNVQPGEPVDGLVLITTAGTTYAGYPLKKVPDADPSTLKLVADFEVRGMEAG